MSVKHDLENYTFLFSGGYSHQVNSDFTISADAVFSYSTIFQPQVLALLNVMYQDVYKVVTGIKTNEALVFGAGFQVSEQLSLMYAYDYNIGEIGAFSKGGHELSLKFFFGYNVNVLNPRDF